MGNSMINSVIIVTMFMFIIISSTSIVITVMASGGMSGPLLRGSYWTYERQS